MKAIISLTARPGKALHGKARRVRAWLGSARPLEGRLTPALSFVSPGRSGLRREQNGSRSGERGTEHREHGQIGMQLNASESAYAERPEAVVVLQAAEGSLNGTASSVEVAPPFALARDQRVEPGRFAPNRARLTLASRAAPVGCAKSISPANHGVQRPGLSFCTPHGDGRRPGVGENRAGPNCSGPGSVQG